MKKTILFVLLPLFLLSCKKYIQQQEENEIISIMTSGVWYVQIYNQNDTSIAPSFTGYTFQFKANGTVTAFLNDIAVATGTWIGDFGNETITSNFPGATDPLDKLNSEWKITDSGTNYVVANTRIGTNNDNLELLKQ
jgi:hypothetical protein